MVTLVDMERPWPWHDHLTLREVALVQGLRGRYEDDYIQQHREDLCPMIEAWRLLAFFRRIERPI